MYTHGLHSSVCMFTPIAPSHVLPYAYLLLQHVCVCIIWQTFVFLCPCCLFVILALMSSSFGSASWRKNTAGVCTCVCFIVVVEMIVSIWMNRYFELFRKHFLLVKMAKDQSVWTLCCILLRLFLFCLSSRHNIFERSFFLWTTYCRVRVAQCRTYASLWIRFGYARRP